METFGDLDRLEGERCRRGPRVVGVLDGVALGDISSIYGV
jgi:hypothetical protein